MSDEYPVQPGQGNEPADAAQPVNPQPELDDLRTSMAEEEQERLRQKNSSGLLKRVTGLLRRKTGMLPAAQPQPAETKPLGPLTGPFPDNETQPPEENLNARVDAVFAQWEEREETAAAETGWGEFHPIDQQDGPLKDAESGQPLPEWAPEVPQPVIYAAGAEPAVEQPEAAASGEAEPADESRPARLDSDVDLIENALDTETTLVDADETPVSFAGETGEHAPIQPEELRAELMPEAAPASDAPKKTTPNLFRRVTGWLNPDAVRPEELPPEVSDDELSERLLKVQSSEPAAGIPGQRKVFYDDYASQETSEAAQDNPEAQDEVVDLFSRLSQAAETESKVTAPDNPRDLAGESVLHRDWVDSQAHFYAEEPVADDLVEHAAAPVQEGIVKTPSRLSELAAAEEAPPAIEEVRSQVLVDYEEPPADAVFTPQVSFAQKAVAWGRKNLRWLIAAFVLLVGAAVLLQVRPWERAPAALPNTPVPSDLPYPVGLELTGGWFFDVNRSTIIENQWQPQGAEWLDNSQLRRVVALPWNKQTDAVIQTLERGDQINLVFSNNDLMPFLVRSVERLERGDTALFSAKDPGLVIFLYGEKSDQRWVVLALPKN